MNPTRSYYRENKEKCRKYWREWYKNNKEKHKKHNKEWYANNKEVCKETNKKWKNKNRERVKKWNREWKRKRTRENPEFRKRGNELSKQSYRRHRAKILIIRAKESKTFKGRARMKLGIAIKSGHIVKPTRCDSCKKKFPIAKIHGHHHRGYKKPLDVIWLCLLCHGELHQIY